MFPWQTSFDRPAFQISLSWVFFFFFFMVLDHFMLFLFVLITVESILRFSKNQESHDGGPSWRTKMAAIQKL